MALEATFRELSRRFLGLHDVVNALQLTFDDKPQNDAAAVADDMGDKTLELLSMIREGHRASVRALGCVRDPADLNQARRALNLCQQLVHRIERKYSCDLVAYEKLKELERVAHRGPEWSAWAGGVKQGIDECRQPIEKVSQALALCWEELAERLGMMNISVHSTGMVQNFAEREPAHEENEVNLKEA